MIAIKVTLSVPDSGLPTDEGDAHYLLLNVLQDALAEFAAKRSPAAAYVDRCYPNLRTEPTRWGRKVRETSGRVELARSISVRSIDVK